MDKNLLLSPRFSLVLPNIRSAHNVGSILRTADAAGVERVYLCGVTPLPVDRFGRVMGAIAKTALGAERTVAWEHVADEWVFFSIFVITEHYCIIIQNQGQIHVAHSKHYQKTYCNAISTNEHMSNRDQNERQ
jgi:hypothetical protein